jgi:hypothetical protein
MARAMPWPCCAPKSSVRRIIRSSVPWSRATRSCSSFRVAIRQEYRSDWTGCQSEWEGRLLSLTLGDDQKIRAIEICKFVDTLRHDESCLHQVLDHQLWADEVILDLFGATQLTSLR